MNNRNLLIFLLIILIGSIISPIVTNKDNTDNSGKEITTKETIDLLMNSLTNRPTTD